MISMDIVIQFNARNTQNKRFKEVEVIKEDRRGAKAIEFKDPTRCGVIFLPGVVKNIRREN